MYVTQMMNDYRQIPGWTVKASRDQYARFLDRLRGAMKEHPDKRFVVVSHHLPSYKLIHPKFLKCCFNSAFASEVPSDCTTQIVAWVAGHTHEPCENGKFHVNPIGYPGEAKGCVNFNKTFSLPVARVADTMP